MKEINDLRKDIEDKKTKIEQLENKIKSINNTEVTKTLNKYVIENFKKNNNQVLEENNSLDIEEQIRLMERGSSKSLKDENNTPINILKEEINEKNKKIEK